MGPYEKPLGCSWVGSWGLWLPRSLHGDHIGRESPRLMPKSRRTKDLALAPASGAEEIGLEGIELGWAGGPQWHPYGTCPPYQICSCSRTSPCHVFCPVPLLMASAGGPSGMLGPRLSKGHWWKDLLSLSLACQLSKSMCISLSSQRTVTLQSDAPYFPSYPSCCFLCLALLLRFRFEE